MNIEALRQSLRNSEAGAATFPQVVQTLIAAHCEGYYKDLAARTVTFYLSDGATHTETLSIPTPPIPDTFYEAALIAAIRAAQCDEVRYPEFIVRAIHAGTAAYRVFITGHRVVYIGRQGDLHVEHFPQAKP
ncbi:MAG TPA: hypothetical protein VHY48_02865 [Acidobacteriaceae bacterium]|jgi:uncharacterized protein YbcV (DUF1398 family)|nr:hypothetical protein [Acidobacteriaceae bacterium]